MQWGQTGSVGVTGPAEGLIKSGCGRRLIDGSSFAVESLNATSPNSFGGRAAPTANTWTCETVRKSVAEISGTELRRHDRVIAHRNRYDLGIMNGDTGTVRHADDRYVYVALDEGRRMRVPHDYVADGLLTQGYATTVHKAQGMTCDETFLGTDGLYAELGYTGLSRGRESNHLYAVAGAWDTTPDKAADPLEHLRTALGASHAQTAAIDIAVEHEPVSRSRGMRH